MSVVAFSAVEKHLPHSPPLHGKMCPEDDAKRECSTRTRRKKAIQRNHVAWIAIKKRGMHPIRVAKRVVVEQAVDLDVLRKNIKKYRYGR